MKIRVLTALFILLLGFPSFLCAQRKIIKAQSQNLVEIIQELERTSDYVFNYDPNQLKDYQFTGQLNLNDFERAISTLLQKTPLTFEQNGQSILVYLPDQQEFQLCGTILDKVSGEPLPLANIITKDFKYGDQSNSQGQFALNFSAHKDQELQISYIGYQTIQIPVLDFIQGKCKTIYLDLDLALFKNAIVVTDYLLDGVTEGEDYSNVSFDYQKLAKNHSIIEQDILKSVQLTPGITSIDESATNLQIRGGTADQNLILWEGATVYDPGHFFGMISPFNPFIIENIKIYKGVFSSSYDNRVGGIIDMSLSDSIPKNIHGSMGTTFTEAHGNLQIPVFRDKLGLIISGRNTINNFFPSPTLLRYSSKVFQNTRVEDGKEEATEQILNYFDWNAKVIFQASKRLRLSGSYLQSGNTFNFELPVSEDRSIADVVNYKSQVMSLEAEVKVSDNWTSKLSLSQSFFENDITTIFYPTDSIDNFIDIDMVFNDIIDQNISFTNSIDLSPNFHLLFGYANDFKRVNFNTTFISQNEPDYEDSNFGEGNFHNLFTSFEYVGKSFQLNAGIRGTYYEEKEEFDFSPRLNIQYAITEDWKLKFSAGVLHQYISQLTQFGFNSIGLNNSAWIINLTETGQDQQARKLSFGTVFSKKGWLVDIEAYSNYTTGLSAFTTNLERRLDLPFFANGESRARGLDVLLKKRWGIFSSWLNYSFGQVNYIFPELDEDVFPGSNDIRHNISWINNIKYKDWTLSLNFQYRTPVPITEATEELEFLENEEDSWYEIEFDGINDGRLDPYQRLDLGISHRHHFEKEGLYTEITFSLLNLLNNDNILNREFIVDEDDNEEAFILELEKFALTRTPQLLLRVSW